MKVDASSASGDPFLDLIFRGLPTFPVPGEETLATDLIVVPGGMATWRTPSARLDLSAVVCAPRGQDPAGRLLAGLMADSGVAWVGRVADATPVTVALPADGDRALVDPDAGADGRRETLAGITTQAIVVDLPSAGLLPVPAAQRASTRSSATRGRDADRSASAGAR